MPHQSDHSRLEELYIQLKDSISANSEESDGFTGRFRDFVVGKTSILHFAIKEAASEDDTRLVKRLLHDIHIYGIDIDTTGRFGRTAPRLAGHQNSASLPALLIEHGASVRQPDKSGYMPIHTALRIAAPPAMFHVLLGSGADPNTWFPTASGLSALKWLASSDKSLWTLERRNYHEYFQMAGLSLHYGADWSILDLEHILCRFVSSYWSDSASSSDLYESVKPILSTYLQAGLDPASVTRSAPLAGYTNMSLLHLTAVHSPCPAMALFIIASRPAHVRLALAEALLVRRVGFNDPGSLPETMRYIHELASQPKALANIEIEVRVFLSQSCATVADVRIFYLCVLHVATKELLNGIPVEHPEAGRNLIELIRVRHRGTAGPCNLQEVAL